MNPKRTILLIEDSATQALKFADALSQKGYTVNCVRSGEEAIETLRKAIPDVIIVDYFLPGMNGDELCRRIRLNSTTRAVPILLMTGSSDDQIETIGLRSGVDDYVSKRENVELVALRIEALLRRYQASHSLSNRGEMIRQPRILIVDDCEVWREFISRKLADSGYSIETAKDAEAGWEKFQQVTFDGAIIDLNLPTISGTWLCDKIVVAQEQGGNQCIIMMMTGEENPEKSLEMLEAGADDVVFKSRKIDVIKARLESLLRRKIVYEEHQRIQNEYREQERQLLLAEAEKESAEERAALADSLERKNFELERAYRELQSAQSQLVHQAKLASLGELVAGIAHEINNPLGFVMSHVETVRDALTSVFERQTQAPNVQSRELIEKALKRVESMETGLERIRDLVINLRTFSRIDEGVVKEIDIHESLDATLALLQHRIRDQITVNRDYQAAPKVQCQPGPLTQVWMNLITNAIDAMQGDGSLTIETRNDNGDIVVSVADTGCGISPDVTPRIFEPFYTTKDQGEGTGLGLSISYSVIRAHQGDIRVESAPAKGTRFTVRLPRATDGVAAQLHTA